MPIPKDLSRMDFLFFGLDPVNRLAGVRLTGRDGKFVELGYRICDDDEDLLYEGFGVRYDLSVSTQRICGFIVAADSKGTRALSVVFEDGQVSKMIGDWHAEERCFVTWQTVGSTAAEIMGATLGIMVKIEYRIIKNITKLVMGFASVGMHFIEVQYNVSVQPLWSVIFGCGPTPTNMAVRELTIDGPGGERITAMNWQITVTSLGVHNLTLLEVCITLASGDKNCQCRANGFQLCTNRGRSVFHEHPILANIGVSDFTVQLNHTDTRLEVYHPDRVVTGLIFVAAERSNSSLRSPLSFQPMGLITRRVEAEPVESSELDGNAALYDCP